MIPLGLLSWDAYFGNLGANPIEYFLRTTGVLTLIFLLITLSVTPLRKMSGWNQLAKFRRMLGLYAFFYAFVHLVTYSVFDKSFDIPSMSEYHSGARPEWLPVQVVTLERPEGV